MNHSDSHLEIQPIGVSAGSLRNRNNRCHSGDDIVHDDVRPELLLDKFVLPAVKSICRQAEFEVPKGRLDLPAALVQQSDFCCRKCLAAEVCQKNLPLPAAFMVGQEDFHNAAMHAAGIFKVFRIALRIANPVNERL